MRCLDLTKKESILQKHNFLHLSKLDKVYCGSKLESDSQVEFLIQEGVSTAIDLKLDGESKFFDQEKLTARGIEYHHFPVSDPGSLSQEDLEKFASLLEKSEGNTLVYCMSSNRVSALLALYLVKVCGHPKQRVVDLLEYMGMTKEALRKKVLSKINL